MAKILVTGGAGFIGSHVVDLFLEKGYEVVTSGVYNLGWGRPTAINEIFFVLAKATGYSHPIQHGPAKVGETRHIYLDAKKAERELGWTPTVSLEQGLEKTISYFSDSEVVL